MTLKEQKELKEHRDYVYSRQYEKHELLPDNTIKVTTYSPFDANVVMMEETHSVATYVILMNYEQNKAIKERMTNL